MRISEEGEDSGQGNWNPVLRVQALTHGERNIYPASSLAKFRANLRRKNAVAMSVKACANIEPTQLKPTSSGFVGFRLGIVGRESPE
jgi:hypothetical protein